MNIETINKWLDEEYGCSYTRLEELHDFYFEKYCDLKKENKQLKKIIDRASARLEYFLIGNLKYQSSQEEFIKLVNILKEVSK